MLLEEITALIGDIPSSIQDLIYVFSFIFMIWFTDRMIGLLTAWFDRK